MARSDRGFTLIELLIVVAIISIIAAIAVPGLLRSKMTANEASAIASLKAIAAAQVSYSTTCGRGGYAASLTTLTGSTPGSADGYLSHDLTYQAAPVKHGYVFGMAPGAGSSATQNDCNGTAAISTFYATATPQTFGTSGGRAFAVTASNTIWQTSTGTPPTEPFAAPSVPAQ